MATNFKFSRDNTTLLEPISHLLSPQNTSGFLFFLSTTGLFFHLHFQWFPWSQRKHTQEEALFPASTTIPTIIKCPVSDLCSFIYGWSTLLYEATFSPCALDPISSRLSGHAWFMQSPNVFDHSDWHIEHIDFFHHLKEVFRSHISLH